MIGGYKEDVRKDQEYFLVGYIAVQRLHIHNMYAAYSLYR